MLTKATVSALMASIAFVAGHYHGFNYGATGPGGVAATQTYYEAQFNAARNLVGHPGFTSARLYTMIQYGTTNDVTEAIPAAIQTQTSLILGMWASAGQAAFNNELAALGTAFETYGSDLIDLLVGIAVGSEDLYRISPTGIANQAGVGAGPHVISSYIRQTRKLLRQNFLKNVKIGHIDTWTAWVNSSNSEVIDASDWVGMDAYPYFQTVDSNSIENGPNLFEDAYQATIGAVGQREVWITETGWPLSGPTSGDAVASVPNAKFYWDAVACKYLGQVNLWWYTLYDAGTSPSFGLTGSTLSSQPVFNLKCNKTASHSGTKSSKTLTASFMRTSVSSSGNYSNESNTAKHRKTVNCKGSLSPAA